MMAITFDQIGELEMIARGGAVVVLKIDGERETDADIFTVMVSGGKLKSGDFFRMDGDSLSSLIDRALKFYKEHSSQTPSEQDDVLDSIQLYSPAGLIVEQELKLLCNMTLPHLRRPTLTHAGGVQHRPQL
jgi:hypothetical protein